MESVITIDEDGDILEGDLNAHHPVGRQYGGQPALNPGGIGIVQKFLFQDGDNGLQLLLLVIVGQIMKTADHDARQQQD